LQALAEFLKNLLVLVHLINKMSVAHGYLLYEYLVLIVKLTLSRQNNLFIELLLKSFDLCLNASINLSAQFFVEGVCNKIGVSLAFSNKVVGQLIDFGDDGLWDNLENLLVSV
jgi:hypothetical protein